VVDWFKNLFRQNYTLTVQACPACLAHKAHIEDLQRLLNSERESYGALQTILFTKLGAIGTPQVSQAEDENGPKPLRSIQTTGQLRRAAAAREREAHPNATADYWARVKDEYEKAGKLPVEAQS
jgi:hypothetical protein